MGGSGGGVNGEDKRRGIWLMFFIYLYENRTMKLVEIILSRGVRENDGGNESNQGTL
jgi:hypothetical protein